MRLPDRLLAQSGFHLRGIPIRGYAVILQDSTSMFRARPPEKVIIEFTDPNQRAKAKGTVIRALIGGASTFGLSGEKQEKNRLNQVLVNVWNPSIGTTSMAV